MATTRRIRPTRTSVSVTRRAPSSVGVHRRGGVIMPRERELLSQERRDIGARRFASREAQAGRREARRAEASRSGELARERASREKGELSRERTQYYTSRAAHGRDPAYERRLAGEGGARRTAPRGTYAEQLAQKAGRMVWDERVKDPKTGKMGGYITAAESARLGRASRQEEVMRHRAQGRGGRVQIQKRAGGPRIDQKHVFDGKYYGFTGEEGAPSEEVRQQFGRTLETAKRMGQASRIRGAKEFIDRLEGQRAAVAPYAGGAAGQQAQGAAGTAGAGPTLAPAKQFQTEELARLEKRNAELLKTGQGDGREHAANQQMINQLEQARAADQTLTGALGPSGPTPPTPAQKSERELQDELNRYDDALGRVETLGGPTSPEYADALEKRHQIARELEGRQAQFRAANQQAMAQIPTTPSQQLAPLPSDQARTWADSRIEEYDRNLQQAQQQLAQQQAGMGQIPDLAAAETLRRWQIPGTPRPPAPISTEGIVPRAMPRGFAGGGLGAGGADAWIPPPKTAEQRLVEQGLRTGEREERTVADQAVLNNVEGPDSYAGSVDPYTPGVGDNATKARVAVGAINQMLARPPTGHTRESVASTIAKQTWYINLPGSIARLKELRGGWTRKFMTVTEPKIAAWDQGLIDAAIESYQELYDVVQASLPAGQGAVAPAQPAAAPQAASPRQAPRQAPDVQGAVDTAASMPGFGG